MDNLNNADAPETPELNFGTPLTARSGSDLRVKAIEEDLPTPEEVAAERAKMELKAAETPAKAREGVPKPAAEVAENEVDATEDAAPPPPSFFTKVNPALLLLPNHDRPPLIMPEGTPTGSYLKQVREECDLTIRQVVDSTKIPLHHLEALEADNMRKMPPAVYVIAYIRKLCDFYNIAQASSDKMVAELHKQLRQDLPDSIINQVELDTEAAEENEREVRRICRIIVLAIAGLLVLAALLGALLWTTLGNSGAVEAEAYTPLVSESAVRELLPSPPPSIPELPPAN